MNKIKVLIVDDSVIYRSQIKEAFQLLPRFEVVGTASNGKIALERLNQFEVDLMILDLEMPELDGLETLKEMQKSTFTCKVILFSSSSKRGAEVTLEALKYGASDFIPKPNGADLTSSTQSALSPSERIKSILELKVNTLFPPVNDSNLDEKSKKISNEVDLSRKKLSLSRFKPQIILIGCSTGGPNVLEKIFSSIRSSIECPIVIVQHMPPLFTASLAERLQKISGIQTSEAKEGDFLEKNRVYIAPGDFHLTLEGSVEKTILRLNKNEPIHSVRPAVDPLFISASNIFKDKCLGFILTGMGYDGKNGAEALKNAGSSVVIQNKESCIVFGMPGAVFSAGLYDQISTPDEIIEMINEKTAA